MSRLPSEDGHSPETCNFRECNAEIKDVPCPFVRDDERFGSKLPTRLTDKFIERLNTDTHQHRHDIPVEWIVTPSHFMLTNPKNGAGVTKPDEAVVTKLRCYCGDEVKRDI